MIVRRLLKFTTLLSLLLALGAFAMWARSQFVTEGWEFEPRAKANVYSGIGWHTYRLVESAGGRLVYADYEWRNDLNGIIPDLSQPGPGYRQATAPLTDELRGRLPTGWQHWQPAATFHHRAVPGVAEWWSTPIGRRRRFISIPWLMVAFVFGILPAFRGANGWWRRRQAARPAFPVITSDHS